jgi:predicted nuclease of predicted toxin-antitoxin system
VDALRFLNLLTATDTQIWERGKVENLVIFSKDVDFYDRALLFGAPPQVVHDRREHLELLSQSASKHALNFLAWCLME